jgi:hypothetical protein
VDEAEDIDDDDEPLNPLIDALFDEVENLRMQVSINCKLLTNLLLIFSFSYSRQK